MTVQPEVLTKSFPFKTLITVVGILIGLLIFKDAITVLLLNTEELTVNNTGIVIRVNKEDAEILKENEENYKAMIAQLNIDLDDQEASINSLSALNEKLAEEIANCPDSQETSKTISTQIKQIQNNSRVLQRETMEIEKYLPKYKLSSSAIQNIRE